jgi:endonuclease YncB( thermonuclease family)
MRWLPLTLFLVGAPGWVAWAGEDEDPPPPQASQGPPPPTSATVTSVYDGDTLTLSTGDRVRLKWVNTPELKPPEQYAVEAREATKAFVSGKTVELGYGGTTRDGYGRLVASVEVDGKLLSEHLLELGLGHLFVIPPDETDLSALIAAQERARQARRGIWSTPEFQGVLHITSFHANADGDDRENVNGEYLRVCNVSAETVDLSGFRIADISGNSWEFPKLLLPAGNTVKVHSGPGTNQSDPAEQLTIHLGSASPIWNNKQDRATIYDRFGRVVDAREHSVQKETP